MVGRVSAGGRERMMKLLTKTVSGLALPHVSVLTTCAVFHKYIYIIQVGMGMLRSNMLR